MSKTSPVSVAIIVTALRPSALLLTTQHSHSSASSSFGGGGGGLLHDVDSGCTTQRPMVKRWIAKDLEGSDRDLIPQSPRGTG
jgi:hypothetical protein